MTDSRSRSTQYDLALERAMSAMAADDSAAAIAALELAAAAAPDAAMPSFLLGAHYARLGQMERAEHALTLALAQDPTLHIARFQLGLLHLTCGKPAHAVLVWQGLDSLPDTHALRLFARGLTALAHDRFDEARANLEQGIVANVDNHPLNGDMHKVLDKIAAATQDRAAIPGAAVEEHFLVSSYGRTTVH